MFKYASFLVVVYNITRAQLLIIATNVKKNQYALQYNQNKVTVISTIDTRSNHPDYPSG
jgi:hypothetical protein